MGRVCLYLRVSSLSQDHELQRVDLIRYAEAHGFLYDIFEDKQSGTNDRRPQYQVMMGKIREGFYSHMIVWRLDRASRSVRDFANLLCELEEARCVFISVREHLNLETPTGRLMISLLSAFAEFEVNVSKDRQRAGIAMARAKGVKFGRPGKYVLPCVIDLERAKGYTMSEVSARLKVSVRRLYEILRNR